jgi:hypothetical protein
MIAGLLPAFRQSLTRYPLPPTSILRLAYSTLRTQFGERPPKEMASLAYVLLALAAQGNAGTGNGGGQDILDKEELQLQKAMCDRAEFTNNLCNVLQVVNAAQNNVICNMRG